MAVQRRRNAVATRGDLLAAAARHFSERGLDGARIDEIAAAAGCNKRMIYAYFGSKDDLYLEVLRTHFDRVLEVGRAAESEGGPRERAEAAVRRYFAFLAVNPDFVRLLSWEVVGATKQAQAVLVERAVKGLEPLLEILREGIRQGVFRADLDVARVVSSVNALCLGHFSHRPLFEGLFKRDLGTRRAQDQSLQHILDLVFHGICTGARPTAAAPHRRTR